MVNQNLLKGAVAQNLQNDTHQRVSREMVGLIDTDVDTTTVPLTIDNRVPLVEQDNATVDTNDTLANTEDSRYNETIETIESKEPVNMNTTNLLLGLGIATIIIIGVASILKKG